MARIRSIHPGMMTDEDYMALSFAARICLAGVWMEADDHGVFEWKPLTLKARIFPADNVNMAELLAELQTHSWVQQFQHEAKTFGVCKNFRKWQRPKKPHYAHPFPNQFGEYIGLKPIGSPPVPHQFPTASTIAPQMEDVGGRMEDEKKEVTPIAPKGARKRAKGEIEYSNAFQRLMEVYPSRGEARNPWPPAWKAWLAALERGGVPEQIIAAAERYAKTESAGTKFTAQTSTWLNQDDWKHAPPVAAVVEIIDPEEAQWRARTSNWKPGKYWNRDQWGPAPNEPGCRAPAHLIPQLADDFDPERDRPAFLKRTA